VAQVLVSKYADHLPLYRQAPRGNCATSGGLSQASDPEAITDLVIVPHHVGRDLGEDLLNDWAAPAQSILSASARRRVGGSES
jgi:hypothetical protein